MDQYIGKLLDNRYEILERIGVGGMAIVYKARCHRLNRLVAIKILRDDLAQDAEFRRRFHDESQAVAMLSHPNIVAVYDVSRNSESEYIVMELIDGVTLKQYMKKKGDKLNWREALHFITQIIKALSHAHSRGIIHRDIKPHNVMVLRDGSVKVADFGIARLASGSHSTLTQEALGSVHYISPEQAKGSRIDARSDLYSAGVVLYEMVTGRLPFEGDSPVSVAIQHINSIPLSPRELDNTIPEALEAITMKAMAPNPDHRYVSADAMLNDLEEFRKNPSINFDYTFYDFAVEEEEGAATQIRPASPKARSNEARGKKSKKPPEDDLDSEDEPPEKGGFPWHVLGAILIILLFLGGVVYFLMQTLSGMFVTPETYLVPSVTGMQYEQAMQNKELLGEFELVLGETLTTNDEAGKILSQEPAGGASVQNPAAVITVIVSAGPESIPMIDVKNQEYLRARVELERLGLKVELPVYEFNDEVAYNHVISFTPLPGTPLNPGDTVRMVVSQGPEEKKVALVNFIGESQAWAESKLNLMNLKANIQLQFSDSVPEGQVMDQHPAVGTEVPEGSEVNLQVSKGIDPSTLPQVRQKKVTVPMPLTGNIVHVRALLDDQEVYSENVDSAMTESVSFSIEGSGTQTLYVYFNGVLNQQMPIDFNS